MLQILINCFSLLLLCYLQHPQLKDEALHHNGCLLLAVLLVFQRSIPLTLLVCSRRHSTTLILASWPKSFTDKANREKLGYWLLLTKKLVNKRFITWSNQNARTRRKRLPSAVTYEANYSSSASLTNSGVQSRGRGSNVAVAGPMSRSRVQSHGRGSNVAAGENDLEFEVTEWKRVIWKKYKGKKIVFMHDTLR